jgi:hypothetical protein
MIPATASNDLLVRSASMTTLCVRRLFFACMTWNSRERVKNWSS